MHKTRPLWHFGLLLAAWLLLFSPRLLPGVGAKTLAWVAISAFLFWPLVLRRWTLWLGVAAVALVGMLDIFYSYYFHTLADEFFLATVLRTNTDEVSDFTKTLPAGPIAASLAWLALCAAIGSLLHRGVPAALSRWPLLRWSWLPAAAVWLLLALGYASGSGARQFEVQDKSRNVYPLHLAWAAVKQHALSDAVLYQPRLPQYPPAAAAQIGTIVAVLGESASAQRWSLLGYTTHATNAPLDGLPGSMAAEVLAKDFMTAGALPFVLTGFSVNDSIARQSPSFLDIAKRAGYKVFVFDNSRTSGNGDFFARVLRRSSDTYQKIGNGGDYDGVLTPWLEQALHDPAAHKLIVLHTFGSHELVDGRYPPDYAKFPDPYDNSILYTSTLLKEWTAMLEKAAGTGSAMLVYTSDHGLAMPPCSDDYIHRRSLTGLEVPYFAWGNASARAQSPQLFTLHGEHGNAILGENTVRALGYGQMSEQGQWPDSAHPTFEGHAWQELHRLDACTLR